MSWRPIDVQIKNPELDLWASRKNRITDYIHDEITEIYETKPVPSIDDLEHGILNVLSWLAESPRITGHGEGREPGEQTLFFYAVCLGRAINGQVTIGKEE